MLFTVRNTIVYDAILIPGELGERRSSYSLAELQRVVLLFRIERVVTRGAVVTKATLVLPLTGKPGQAGTLGIASILRPWPAFSASWESPWSVPGGREGVDHGAVRATPVVAGVGGEIVHVPFDVTDDVRAWVSGTRQNHGWMISGDVRIGGAANPHIAATPRLDVQYSEGSGSAHGAGLAGAV